MTEDSSSATHHTRRPEMRCLAACLLLVALQLPPPSAAFSIRELIRAGGKRTDPNAPMSPAAAAAFGAPRPAGGFARHPQAPGSTTQCPTWHPFECPSGECVPIKYLCDGSPDCSDEYDENKSMCTAATRPPVEETAAFLKALMHAHGGDFLVKVFGDKAKSELAAMGGVDKVAVALSQSPTADVFASEMKLDEQEMMKMVETLEAIIAGNAEGLTSSESADFRFFAQKLQETGFF